MSPGRSDRAVVLPDFDPAVTAIVAGPTGSLEPFVMAGSVRQVQEQVPPAWRTTDAGR